MALMEKSKLQAFAKKTANPPLAAVALTAKRAQAKPPAAPSPVAPQSPVAQKGAPGAADAGGEGEESEVYLHELVEEAAQAAEAGADQDLEDAVAGYTSAGAQDVPGWAEDPDAWKQAADAVGLGQPGIEDRYDEPFVVAAYLYKKLGGPVKGMELPEVPGEAGESVEPADMSKPGAAAKAIATRAAGKPPEGEGPPAAKPPAPAPAPQAAAPVPAPSPKGKADAPVAAPGMKAPVAPPPGAPAPTDDLKQMLDAAAQQAQTAPDPQMLQKLQQEPPMEGAPPSWAADQDKWSKAEQAVKPHWSEYPEPFVVVAHVYKNMGGTVH